MGSRAPHNEVPQLSKTALYQRLQDFEMRQNLSFTTFAEKTYQNINSCSKNGQEFFVI